MSNNGKETRVVELACKHGFLLARNDSSGCYIVWRRFRFAVARRCYSSVILCQEYEPSARYYWCLYWIVLRGCGYAYYWERGGDILCNGRVSGHLVQCRVVILKR
jgi:hypothetical protein